VDQLKKRRYDALTENRLLKQLTSLWQRLCSEVENEIQTGVNQQLNFKGDQRCPAPLMTRAAAAARASKPTAAKAVASQSSKQGTPVILDQKGHPNQRMIECQTTRQILQAGPPPLVPMAELEQNNNKRSSNGIDGKPADSLVLVVLPPTPTEAQCGGVVADPADEMEQMETDESGTGETGVTATYELQLQDEVVPVIITSSASSPTVLTNTTSQSMSTTKEEEDFNNGRDFVKIAPRKQTFDGSCNLQAQRIFLLNAADTESA